MPATTPPPSAFDLTGTKWQKSSHSGGSGNCVEMAAVDGYVLMRNSNHPERPASVFTQAEIAAYLAGVKDGEFDHFARP